jgi:aminoglycoside phosphotransferase (APT) family kinase protein
VILQRTPPADVAIDASLVHALLRDQHPDLADRALVPVGEGWDNALFRAGDDLLVRLPRRAVAAPLIEHEQRWLPGLADGLPLQVPVPVRFGRPGRGYPWAWSVVPWLEGRSAAEAIYDAADAASMLGRFLAALHRTAPSDAPHNRLRSSLEARYDRCLQHIDALDAHVDAAAARREWERLVRTPPWGGPALWTHGDLHPGNILVHGGRLTAVIDFGDLAAGGDPAVDFAAAWMFLPADVWPAFRRAATNQFRAADDRLWTRARGWALTLGAAFLANSLDSPVMAAIGSRTLATVLAGADSSR